MNYPEWDVSGHNRIHVESWYQTNEEAFSGNYSIRSPDLSSHNGTYYSATASLQTDPDWGSGYLYFSILANNFTHPYDIVQWYVDEMKVGSIKEGTPGWETGEILIENGGSIVSWVYKYNPKKKANAPASNGVAYIDDIYFIPFGQTLEPTVRMPPAKKIVSSLAPLFISLVTNLLCFFLLKHTH